MMNLSTVTQLVGGLVGIHPRNCFVEIGDGSREEGDRTPSPIAYSVMERERLLGGGGHLRILTANENLVCRLCLEDA